MEAEEPLVQDIELDVTEVENIVIDGVDSKITGLRIVGKILLLAGVCKSGAYSIMFWVGC